MVWSGLKGLPDDVWLLTRLSNVLALCLLMFFLDLVPIKYNFLNIFCCLWIRECRVGGVVVVEPIVRKCLAQSKMIGNVVYIIGD